MHKKMGNSSTGFLHKAPKYNAAEISSSGLKAILK